MRVERAGDQAFGRLLGVLAAVSAVTLAGLLFGSLGAVAGGVLGLFVAAAMHTAFARRAQRRRAALASPFPEGWRRLLQERYDHYERLPEDLRGRFEDDLRLFLLEKRITGVGVEVTDERRLLVAASAVTLSLGWPDYEWSQLTEVLLYPQSFDRDYAFDDKEPLVGQAHPWGTVILSVPALEDSFDDADDAYHVGLHEFAHLLDVEQTEFDGIPKGFPPERAKEWVALAQREMERMLSGRSVMDDYGAYDPVEFLAVAVEAFFEAALALRRDHREVYEILSAYFRQDPAAWDDERGLVLDE